MAEPNAPAAPAPADAAAPAAPVEGDYRAEFAKQMAELRNGQKEPEPEKPAEKPAEATEDEDEDVEEADDEEEAVEDEDEGEAAEEDEEPKDAKGKYTQALRKLQKKEEAFEKHRTSVLAKEREVGALEKKLATQRADLGRFIEAMKTDPVGVLEREGLLTEDDKQHWMRQFHYLSGEAGKDPRSRAEAERLRRDRERDQALKKQQEKIDSFEKEREAERAKVAQEAELKDYVSKLDGTVEQYKAKTPLLEKALAKNAQKTTRELRQIAHDLSVAQGAWAEPKAVVTEWVKRRKELLAELDVVEPGATATPKKAKSKSAAEQKGPGTEPSNKGSSAAVPPANETAEQREAREERARKKELRQMLREARGEPAED